MDLATEMLLLDGSGLLGGAGKPPVSPSLDFSKSANSQYTSVVGF